MTTSVAPKSAVVTAMNHRTFSSVANLGVFSLALALGAMAVGCSSSSDKAPASSADGPGASVVSDIISCQTDSDCKSGETCGQGFCQMKRCASSTYTSQPPLGKAGYAYIDRALVVASSDSNLQVFSSYAKGGSTLVTDAPPTDIAGGNLTGSRPEAIAFVNSSSGDLTVLGADGGAPQKIALGFAGLKVATGDVDGDGIDEILVGGAGQYALCSATSGTCKQGTLSGTPDDVAIGDVNGDGAGDLLFIGNHVLTIIDGASGKTDTQPFTANLINITAGDLDGDGTAEIIGTEPGGTFSSDKMHVYTLSGVLSVAADLDLSYGGSSALDLVFAKQDNTPVVAVLQDGGTLRTFTYASKTITPGSQAAVDGYAGRRVAASDLNGRSAAVRLSGDPKLLVGPPKPISVLTLPPYSGQHSSGPSSVTMGTSTEGSTSNSQSASTTTSTTLSLNSSIAFSAIPLAPSLSYFIQKSWGQTTSHSATQGTSLSVGSSYSVSADPAVDGYNSGAVVLAGGCFHEYDYSVDDPAGVLGTTQSSLVTFVPVGGETTLWSTARYNALVDALGDGSLPKVTIQPKLGDVSSYPSTPTTIDGQPIPDADDVFTNPPLTRTSDVGTVSFSLSASTSQTNATSTSFNWGTTMTGSAGITIPVVNISETVQAGSDTSYSLDDSYSVTVGSSASFSGSISPVRDDPSTPANEASIYGYSFTPYVYRHHYTDASGKEGAFYAVTYTTGD